MFLKIINCYRKQFFPQQTIKVQQTLNGSQIIFDHSRQGKDNLFNKLCWKTEYPHAQSEAEPLVPVLP